MSPSAKAVRESQVRMTELLLPTHTNALDTAFGGVIMSWIDICAAIAAQRHAGCQVVTASIDALNFVAPVKKGWVVNLFASVNRAFRSSMEIGVRVDAENPISGQNLHTATAYLTFVALDDLSKKREVPKIIAETQEEKRRYEEAQRRRQLRLQYIKTT
tara:strand:- start:8810 stop:9286 length:477 start_codon:yes stop_codon:yes gene_type:complete